MLTGQATAASSGAATLGLDRVSGCGAVRSAPGSPGAGSAADNHLYGVSQPKLSWPVQSWRMIMSLSLFDLSDYPGNQVSYCTGIIQGSAGEKQSNNNPGPGPPWSKSSYSWRQANGSGVFPLLPPYPKHVSATNGPLPQEADAFLGERSWR